MAVLGLDDNYKGLTIQGDTGQLLQFSPCLNGIPDPQNLNLNLETKLLFKFRIVFEG